MGAEPIWGLQRLLGLQRLPRWGAAATVRGTWGLQRLLALQGRLGGCSDCEEHLGAAAIWLQGTRELQRL